MYNWTNLIVEHDPYTLELFYPQWINEDIVFLYRCLVYMEGKAGGRGSISVHLNLAFNEINMPIYNNI